MPLMGPTQEIEHALIPCFCVCCTHRSSDSSGSPLAPFQRASDIIMKNIHARSIFHEIGQFPDGGIKNFSAVIGYNVVWFEISKE